MKFTAKSNNEKDFISKGGLIPYAIKFVISKKNIIKSTFWVQFLELSHGSIFINQKENMQETDLDGQFPAVKIV